MRLRYAAAPLLALIIAGCSSGTIKIMPKPSPAPPPANGGSYATAEDVNAALTRHGIPCTSASPIADTTADGATSLIDCTGATAGDTSIAVFQTHAQALDFAQHMSNVGLGITSYEAIGVNWVVNTSTAYGKRVNAALGGTSINGSQTP